VKNQPTGEGWKEFQAWITWEDETQPIATHSSYVKIGGDLGLYGLFFFSTAIWTAIRSLSTLRNTGDIELERLRRVCLILVLSYCLSSWMVNREYHPEYFLMIAVTAALHRVALLRPVADRLVTQEDADASTETAQPPIWNRFGLIDFAASVGLTYTILGCWDHVFKNL